MPDGVRTAVELKEVVEDYLEFDEFVIDVETLADTKEQRLDPLRNSIFWISLAGPGRADVIPCGHPRGERIIFDPADTQHRVTKQGNKHQERRVNPDTGREKWFDIPPPFTAPPPQLFTSEVTEALRPLLFSDRRKIGHNIKFDIRSLAKYYGEMPPPPYGDTEIAARLVNENYPAYDLKICVSRAFRYKYAKLGKELEMYPYSEAHQYSYLDAKYCWLLWRKFKERLETEGVRHIFDLEMDLLPTIIDMEEAGVRIDAKALAELGREFALDMAKLKVDIDKAAGYEINLNANAQVADLVYDKLGHKAKCTCSWASNSRQETHEKSCYGYTPSGQRKTSKDSLELFSKDPIVTGILDHSALNKLQGSFVEGIQKRLVESTVHPTFKQAGTVSGRMSCTEPNIQQVPSRTERGKRIREVFIARPGMSLVVADLSQIELRVLAHYTQDKVLLRTYREGTTSLHALLAERVFGADYTPLQYSLAKNGNFSITYGASAPTLVRRYGFPSIKLAELVRDGFYDTYKRVAPWKDEVWAEARSHYKKGKQSPYVTTILGRKRRLPEMYSIDRKRRAGAERQAISSIIQGTAADLFKLAMIDCDDLLMATGWDAHILMTVHDELVVEVPERHAEEGLTIVKGALESIMDPSSGEPILSVPLVADAHIVQRWSEAKQ